MGNYNQDFRDEGRSDRGDRGERGEKGDKEGRKGGGASFQRKKVCPFILDKTLLLNFKNLKVMQRFIGETGKIVPRRISGVTAKNQRALTKHIKRARNIGFIAPVTQD